ncbi:MAG: M20 family metallopeptidase [Acidimicrobiales bacterium]
MSGSGTSDLKKRLHGVVDERTEQLLGVSHDIWANPELCFEEHHAHDVLVEVLDGAGLAVEAHAFGLDTAFVATAGTDGPTVGVICEYDALPGLGHACGHNIIAASGLGAGLAAATVADELGCTVKVFGTPAEEGGGGKVFMVERGAFEGVDAALMVHPSGRDLTTMSTLAIDQLRATYTGAEAHAAAAPHVGRNALDAAVLGYMGVAALRQHMTDSERVHGVITHGGEKPNIVPARAETEWYVRSPTLGGLDELCARVQAALRSGATATGCTCSIEAQGRRYADMIDNRALLAAFVSNARQLGREMKEPTARTRVQGSTDMGDVSYAVPSIHPMIAAAPHDVSIHTERFAGYAASPSGDAAVIDGAKILASTLVDVWLDDALRSDAADEFDAASDSA